MLRAESIRENLLKKRALSLETVRQAPKAVDPDGSLTQSEWLQLAIKTGIFANTLEFKSNESSFDRKTRNAILVGIEGNIWVTPSVGINFAYQQGTVEFDEFDSTRIDVEAVLRWIEVGIQYRYLFVDIEGAPTIVGGVGYHFYDFDVAQSDTMLLTDNTLKGPFISLELNYTLFYDLSLGVELQFIPFMDYQESPGSSGKDSTTIGFRFETGAHYVLTEAITAGVSYQYGAYHTDFSGVGSREGGLVTDSEADERYHIFSIELVAVF